MLYLSAAGVISIPGDITLCLVCSEYLRIGNHPEFRTWVHWGLS